MVHGRGKRSFAYSKNVMSDASRSLALPFTSNSTIPFLGRKTRRATPIGRAPPPQPTIHTELDVKITGDHGYNYWKVKLNYPKFSVRSLRVFNTATINDEEFNDLFNGLVEVTTNIRLINTDLTSVILPKLVSVGGNLEVNENKELTSFTFTKLVSVGGNLKVDDNKILTSFTFTKLVTIGGDLSIINNKELPQSVTDLKSYFLMWINQGICVTGILTVITNKDANPDPPDLNVIFRGGCP